MKIQAYYEYKPMKDCVEITFYVVNQLGRKARWDFDLPASLFTRPGPAWDSDEEITFVNAKEHVEPLEIFEPLYPARPWPVTFEEYMLNDVIHPRGYEDVEGQARIDKFFADKATREPFYRENYEKHVAPETSWRARDWKRWQETLKLIEEKGLTMEEAGVYNP